MSAGLRGGAGGFTLLEMMIGLVLLGLTMTVLFSALRLGASSWDAAERGVSAVAEQELAIRVLEQQLALAMPVMTLPEDGPERLAFEGASDRLTWVAPLPAHRGGGGVHELEVVLGATDRGEGLILRYRLFHPDALADSSDAGRESVLLLEDVRSLRATYYGIPEGSDRAEWSERWHHDRELPLLVKLEWTLATSPEDWVQLVVEPRQRYRSLDVDFGPFPN